MRIRGASLLDCRRCAISPDSDGIFAYGGILDADCPVFGDIGRLWPLAAFSHVPCLRRAARRPVTAHAAPAQCEIIAGIMLGNLPRQNRAGKQSLYQPKILAPSIKSGAVDKLMSRGNAMTMSPNQYTHDRCLRGVDSIFLPAISRRACRCLSIAWKSHLSASMLRPWRQRAKHRLPGHQYQNRSLACQHTAPYRYRHFAPEQCIFIGSGHYGWPRQCRVARPVTLRGSGWRHS